MNSSTYRFVLNLHTSQSQISIPVLLGDTGRTFRISLSDGGIPYIIVDGCLAKLSIKRPTGTHIEEFCAVEDNTTVVYDFAQNENTAAVEGIHECDVSVYGSDGKVLATARFSMVVSDRVVAVDDVVLTDDDFTAVDAMLVEEAKRQVEEAKRVSAETERISAESERISAESERVSNEETRVNSENERAELFKKTRDKIDSEIKRIERIGKPVTVAKITESTEDGGDNVVTFTDGTSLTVKNGRQGSQGLQGIQGETGKSAYAYAQDGGYTGTEAEFAEDINPDNMKVDIAEIITPDIVEIVKAEVPLVKTAEQPTFVNSIDEMTDTSKVYVMPDGYMYAHVTEKNYNLFILNDVQVPNRLQDDNTEIISSTSNAVTGFIPVQYGKYYSFSAEFGGVRKVLNTGSENPNIVRMNVKKTDGTVVALGKSVPYGSPNNAITIPSNDIVAIQFQFKFVTNGGSVLSIANIEDVRAYKPMFVEGNTQTEAVENATNLPYIEGTGETISTWKNTGLAYNQPTDYEERVIELENRVEELETSVEELKNNNTENVLLNEKTILNFGDSIAEGGANNYRNYCTIIGEKYNMSVNSVAVGGAIMARNSALSGTHSVLTQIDNAISNHGSKTFDFIMLEGGTNDLNYIARNQEQVGAITDYYDGNYDETTAIGALEKAIYLIRTTWLSSNIIFVIPHHMSSRDYAITKELWSKYVEVCKKWGIPVVNVYEEGQYNTFIASMNALYARESTTTDTGYDRTHPNEDGYKKWYCPLIVSKMKEIVFE